jgi:deoxyribodipyrimidine photolyase-related protein
MVLFADGGYLATKPYAAGGSYINKMSDYCKNCDYKVSKKSGDDACPFNYLYWYFLVRNRSKLQHNYRISMMYKTYDKMSTDKKQAILEDGDKFFEAIARGITV